MFKFFLFHVNDFGGPFLCRKATFLHLCIGCKVGASAATTPRHAKTNVPQPAPSTTLAIGRRRLGVHVVRLVHHLHGGEANLSIGVHPKRNKIAEFFPESLFLTALFLVQSLSFSFGCAEKNLQTLCNLIRHFDYRSKKTQTFLPK